MKNTVHLFLALTSFFFLSCEKSDNGSTGGNVSRGGSMAGFAISGDHLYALNGSDLEILSLENPAHPQQMGSYRLGVAPETLFPRDENTLFVGMEDGMRIFNTSSAPQITFLGEYSHITGCDPVVANEEYAYVTLRSSENRCQGNSNQLDIVDIRDLSSPELVNTVEMNGPRGLGLMGDTLLVCDEGITIFDASAGDSVAFIDKVPNNQALDIIVLEETLLILEENGFSQYTYEDGELIKISEL